MGIQTSGGVATDATLSMSDITTNNVSTTQHGFAPKAPNNTTTFLRGDATYAAPAGGSSTMVGYSTLLSAAGEVDETDTSGGTTVFGTSGAQMDVTTTAGSRTESSRTVLNFTTLDFSVDSQFSTLYKATNVASPGAASIVHGYAQTNAADITFTTEHYGVEMAMATGDNEAFASNGSGTTQTRTSMGIANSKHITCIFDTGVNVKFYDGTTLDATHTTNLPTGAYANGPVSLTFGFTNKNGSDAGTLYVNWIETRYLVV